MEDQGEVAKMFASLFIDNPRVTAARLMMALTEEKTSFTDDEDIPRSNR